MKWVVRAFAVAMVAGGIFMGYYAGIELVAVTGSFQWELAVAWWFIGLVAGALFLTLDSVLSHLQPPESPNTEKTKRNMNNIKMNIMDMLAIHKNDKNNRSTTMLSMEKNKVYPVNFGTKRIGFTKREPSKSKTM